MSDFSRDKHREFGFPRDMEVLPGFMRDPGPPPPFAAASSTRARIFSSSGGWSRSRASKTSSTPSPTSMRRTSSIAGEGTQRRSLVARAAGNPRVRFVGFQSGAELSALYSGAHAVIASSRGYETFGLSVIEAYSRGVPVLARRMGSYLELVENSGAGETFADVADLQAAMRRMLADPARRREMSRDRLRVVSRHLQRRRRGAALSRARGSHRCRVVRPCRPGQRRRRRSPAHV